MPIVAVSMLRSGERILENVITPLGGLLFEKDRILSPRDIEILKAFMVRYVDIEIKNVEIANHPSKGILHEPDQDNNNSLYFYKEYDDLFKLLSRSFALVRTGGILPLLELRKQLERLLSQLRFYNLLVFTPRHSSTHDYLIHKSIMTSLSSYQLARWCSIPVKDWFPAAMAGLLHDLGNARVDQAILYKPSRLSHEEFEELKKHTIIGYNILKNIPGINDGIKLAALQHHERVDGSGYPLHVKGEKIHHFAKIVAVTDTFHAMTAERQYKKASSPYLVLEELLKESFGKLDPETVQIFIQKVTQFHNGMMVRLNNDEKGEIIFTDRNHPTRPMVNVDGKIINLAQERSNFIKEVLLE